MRMTERNNKSKQRLFNTIEKSDIIILGIAFILIVIAVFVIRGGSSGNSTKTPSIVSSSTNFTKTEIITTVSVTSMTTIPLTQNSTAPEFVKASFVAAGADILYASEHPYCIAVNTTQNIVIVYERSEDGIFTNPIKAMTCSCGKIDSPTKEGTFKTSEKFVWHALNGGVYGQYATRIDGPYLFHSVPYYEQNPATLETEEYNHLGENRSLGCVRLAVKDCKWIYDNCPSGTIVTIYSDGSIQEPLSKPTSTIIPTSGVKSGWDPTDPEPDNPWAENE